MDLANLDELGKPRTSADDEKINWTTGTAMVLLHLGAIAGLFFFTWKALFLAIFLWWLSTSLGIGVCYHRLLTHRGYKTPKWVEYILTVFATLSLEGGPIFWVATHRIHHQFSDQDGDPHSPRDGKWWAHAGWILVGKSMHHDTSTLAHYVPDLAKDRFHVWITKYHCVPMIVLGVTLLAVGGWSMFLWGICLRTVVGLHSTWAVNSATHSWGSRRFRTRDDSTNSWWVALLTWGEGWHNNHHAHPSSSRHGLAWYEIDLNWYAIWTMQKLGLAWSVYRYKLPKLMAQAQAAVSAGAAQAKAKSNELQLIRLPKLGARFERAWGRRIFSFRDLANKSAESASAIGNKILPDRGFTAGSGLGVEN
jgi:sn-1 stearoyl-lipid 9-desaturase